MLRFRIVNLLVMVAVMALGLAAMRDASPLAEQIMFSTMATALVVGWLGARVRKPDPAWTGFAILASVYTVLTFYPPVALQVKDHLITTRLVNAATDRLLAVPPVPQPPGFAQAIRQGPAGRERLVHGSWVALTLDEENIDANYTKQSRVHWDFVRELGPRYQAAQRIGHGMLVIVFGLVGSLLGPWLASWRRSREPRASGQPGHVVPALSQSVSPRSSLSTANGLE